MGLLLEDRSALQGALEGHVGRGFVRLEIRPPTFVLAADLLLADPALGLRAADALHLAVAAEHGETLVTLDRTLLQAARAVGIDATDGGVLDPDPRRPAGP